MLEKLRAWVEEGKINCRLRRNECEGAKDGVGGG